jgi:hypothetical protein
MWEGGSKFELAFWDNILEVKFTKDRLFWRRMWIKINRKTTKDCKAFSGPPHPHEGFRRVCCFEKIDIWKINLASDHKGNKF